jgi:ABC-type branched-subunit amino acid transport system substrate-binding protein
MSNLSTNRIPSLIGPIALALLGTGCVVFSEEIAPFVEPPECVQATDCSQDDGPAMCINVPGTTQATCQKLLSEDCGLVPSVSFGTAPNITVLPELPALVGDHLAPNALLIASLFQIKGSQAQQNIPRLMAAVMAAEEINQTNATNGILLSDEPGDTRELVMLQCDAFTDLPRVARHLINDLHLTAIVGPNNSQDTLDLTTGDPERDLPSSAANGVALVSPTAVAAAITSVPDNGLTYMMQPSDAQRLELMIARYKELEAQLRAQRGNRPLRLQILYRNDALGFGTKDGLAAAPTMLVNGLSLAAASQQGNFEQDSYEGSATEADHTELLAKVGTYAPDIMLFVGGSEGLKSFLKRYEANMTTQGVTEKTHYIAIDSTKNQALLDMVKTNAELRLRLSGTGLATSAESAPILTAFQLAYEDRWDNASLSTVAGVGASYDAVYTVALAMVGQRKDGRDPKIHEVDQLKAGMARLSTNTAPCTHDGILLNAPCFSITDHSRTLFQNMGMLLDKTSVVTEIGSSGRLEWEQSGARSDGVIEIWCVSGAGGTPSFQPSGQTFDIKTRTLVGEYTQCL